jgi:hypothetical protein
VEIQKDGTALPALHVATKLLWSSAKQYSLKDGSVVVGAGRWADLSGWLLPSKDELYSFASANGNPYRTGKAYRLLAAENPSAYCWLTIRGGPIRTVVVGEYRCRDIFLPATRFLKNASDIEISIEMIRRDG